MHKGQAKKSPLLKPTRCSIHIKSSQMVAIWPLHASLHCLFPLSTQLAEAAQCKPDGSHADCSSITVPPRSVQTLGAASTANNLSSGLTPT